MKTFTGASVSCDRKSKKLSISDYEWKAYDAQKSQKYELALKYYSTLIDIVDSNGSYFFNRGYCYSMQLEQSAAVKDYLTAAKFNYRRGASFYNIGLIKAFQKDDKAAFNYFRQALTYLPNRADILREFEECANRLKSKKD